MTLMFTCPPFLLISTPLLEVIHYLINDSLFTGKRISPLSTTHPITSTPHIMEADLELQIPGNPLHTLCLALIEGGRASVECPEYERLQTLRFMDAQEVLSSLDAPEALIMTLMFTHLANKHSPIRSYPINMVCLQEKTISPLPTTHPITSTPHIMEADLG